MIRFSLGMGGLLILMSLDPVLVADDVDMAWWQSSDPHLIDGSPIDASSLGQSVDSYFRDAVTAYDESVTEEFLIEEIQSPRQTGGLEALPDGLLWRSYLAAPHEPRISTILFSDAEGGGFWDATLGGRVGLLRSMDPCRPRRGWQWDLEGAVMTRLDLLHAEDVSSMDYRFGTQITTLNGPWATKFGYFHISSHAGDEFLIRNPTFERVNYVTESLVAAVSYNIQDIWRLYGETAFAVKTSGGAKPWQFQTGVEYVRPISKVGKAAPFVAVNLDIRQVVDFEPSVTAQTGWLWQGPNSGRRFRCGFHYANGHSTQFQFFRQREEAIGGGFWFDY
jgi:hypothetical protein